MVHSFPEWSKTENNCWNSKNTFFFVQLGCSTSNWQKSPVEYWFIKTQDTVFMHEEKCSIKTKWNEMGLIKKEKLILEGK